jgi:hypothetical protein
MQYNKQKGLIWAHQPLSLQMLLWWYSNAEQCFSQVTNTQKKTDDDFQSTAQWDYQWKWQQHTGISVLCLLLYSPLATSGLSNGWKNLLLVKVMTVNIKMKRTARWLARNIDTCTMSGKRNSSKEIWRLSTHGTSFYCFALYTSFTYTLARKCKNIVDCCSYTSNKWHAIREGKEWCPCSCIWLEIHIQ